MKSTSAREPAIVMSVRSEFMRYRDRPFVLIAAGGNWGDELIWWGAETLADEVGLNWTAMDLTRFLHAKVDPEAVIYIHGGGGYNPWGSGRVLAALTHALKVHEGVVIQGPQSIERSDEYINAMLAAMGAPERAERVVFFARERTTHGILESHAPSWMEFAIDVDTALHLDRKRFIERAGISRPRYDLFAARADDEAPGAVSLPDLEGVRLDPALFARSFRQWLRIHAAAKRIVTNRTHSSVAGAVLQIPTYLLGGSYHKNRSIWEYALADRGVQWLEYDDTMPFKIRTRPELLSLLPQSIRTSWKVQRINQYLKGVPSS